MYPKRVAVLSILYLSIGDPCASTAGIMYGHLSTRFVRAKLCGCSSAKRIMIDSCRSRAILCGGVSCIWDGQLPIHDAEVTVQLTGFLRIRFSNGKSLVGFIGGVVSCTVVTYAYYVREMEISTTLLLVSAVGGLCGAVTELLCGRKVEGSGGPIDIDDNLAVPAGSGLLLYGALACFIPTFL